MTDQKTVFIPLPYSLRRTIFSGCQCPYCKAHPHQTPQWDAVGWDGEESWTVHYPEIVHKS